MRLKANELTKNYLVLRLSYCEAQTLLNPLHKVGYTCGAYGWNSDIYFIDSGWSRYVISTGYRPIGHLYPDRKMVEHYEKLAEKYALKHPDLDQRAKHSKMLLIRLYKRTYNLWQK